MKKYSLPLFIKVFSYFFLAAALLMPIGILFVIYNGGRMVFLGLRTESLLSIEGIVITLIWIIKGGVGWGLLKRKSWALKAALIDAIISIGIYLPATIAPFIYYDPYATRTIGFEIIALIPYLLVMLNFNSKQRLVSA